MNFLNDRQIRRYCGFLALFAALSLTLFGGLLLGAQRAANAVLLARQQAAASVLLAEGVPPLIVADALTAAGASADGIRLLDALGGAACDLPLRWTALPLLLAMLLFGVLLPAGTVLFFRRRERLCLQAEDALARYLDGDFTPHLPQLQEGTLFRLFASVEQLAAMLQSRNEAGQQARVFLKNTISDISHQLKTPLAALHMYQEILANEPGNVQTVERFTARMEVSLCRMERLLRSLLALTRLDAGAITFEKADCPLGALIGTAAADLTARAESEGKRILITGDPAQRLRCDPAWTGEAVANLIGNALDHTAPGGTVHVSWERTPALLRILVADDGCGIAPEDIHHIFKRFYRSKYAKDTPGIGLGLPLAKAIVERQGGTLTASSEPGAGAVFTISFFPSELEANPGTISLNGKKTGESERFP